jgi:hypothetical protein
MDSNKKTTMGSQSWWKWLATAGLVLLAMTLLLLNAAPSRAAQIHAFSSSFGAGELNLAANSGVAVNEETGNLYVADTGNDRIAEYTPAGAPTANSFPNIASPVFIAVDNSLGSSRGDVYVATSTKIFKFNSSGTAVTTWGAGGTVDGSSTEHGAFGGLGIGGIAVAADGTLYAYRDVSGTSWVAEFEPSGAFKEEFQSPYGLSPNGTAVDVSGNVYIVRGNEHGAGKIGLTGVERTTGVDVDPGPATGLAIGEGTHLYVSHADHVTQYSANLRLLETFGAGELTGGAGIAIAANGTAYVADSAGGEIDVFGALLVPEGETKVPAPATVTRTTAIFRGTINASGGPAATCTFQYLTDAEAEHNEAEDKEAFEGASSAPCTPAGPFTGEVTQEVSAQVTGLELGTEYMVRLLPHNANGDNKGAGEVPFQTKPAVSVEPEEATEVKRSTAFLNGTLNPEGVEPETCEFEYATKSEGLGAGTKVPCAEDVGSIGQGNAPVPVYAEITGLPAATEYVFRMVGKNALGTTESEGIVAFTTLPAVNLVTGNATDVAPTSATLSGTVDPEGSAVTGCEFEYLTGSEFEENVKNHLDGFTAAAKQACAQSQGQIGEGTAGVPVSAAITGLSPNTVYHVRLAGTSGFGSATAKNETTFESFGPPTIGEAEAKEVTSTSAVIAAQVNPHGELTRFVVEYVTQSQFEASAFAGATVVPAPPQTIGPKPGPTTVTQELTGLSPETVYRFRVVAENAAAPQPAEEEGAPFTTRELVSSILPDGRAYELVSPPSKSAELIPPESALTLGYLSGTCEVRETSCTAGAQLAPAPVQISPDGDAITYYGLPFAPGGAPGGNQYLTSRNSGGWAPPSFLSSSLFGSSNNGNYLAFSTDLSRSILFQERLPLSPSAPVEGNRTFNNLYLAEGGDFTPLVTSKPPNRVARPNNGTSDPNQFELFYAGANQGAGDARPFSHVIFAANDALTEEIPGIAPAAPQIAGQNNQCRIKEDCNLYEWDEGKLRLVNVLPGNTEVAANSDFGEPTNEAYGAHYDHAISSDGTHIFWSTGGKLFVRIDGTETEAVEDPGHYVIASADGSKVLLSDGCLYELAAGECTFKLAGKKGGFEGILGATDDLSTIYFVDTAALGGENARLQRPVKGKDNLYMFRSGESENETVFITTLASTDNQLIGEGLANDGDWRRSASHRTAQVSPDGDYIAFMSGASLTGFNNRIAPGHEVNEGGQNHGCRHGISTECFEVFEYSAAAETLWCPSCNRTGTRPLGSANLTLIKPSGFQKADISPPRNLTAGGRLFFESRDVLTAGDRNGSTQDVYEWQPPGLSSCSEADGCVSLISPGEGDSEEEPHFVGASPGGEDVFFETRRRLVPRDKDGLLDLYDARAPHVPGEVVGSQEAPALICEEQAVPCRSISPAPQAPGTPASSALTGSGNSRPKCKKGFIKKHGGKCVKKPKQRKKKHKSKKHRGKNGAKTNKKAGNHAKGGSK